MDLLNEIVSSFNQLEIFDLLEWKPTPLRMLLTLNPLRGFVPNQFQMKQHTRFAIEVMWIVS